MDETVGLERGPRPGPRPTGQGEQVTEAACLLSAPSSATFQSAAKQGIVQDVMAAASAKQGESHAGHAEAGGAAGGAGGAGGASCWGLLLALSIHSIIEGLAVGLEQTSEQVIFLLGAVSSHKLVVSFCLGAELVGGGVALVPHLVAVSVFALGSAAGVGVGMALYGLPGAGAMAGAAGASASQDPDPLLLPVLQASAAGTLLYVTLAEVLPRERARSQHNFPRRLLQFLSFSTGAAIITALVFAMPDSHDQEPFGPR